MLLSTVLSPGPILCSAHFIINFIATVAITFGANFGIMWGIADTWPSKRVLFDTSTLGNILGTHVLLALLCFFGTGTIRQRVKAGSAPPLAQTWLCDTAVKRILFFSLAVPNWKARALRFVANSLMLCSIPVTIVLALSCWASLGFPALTTKEVCNTISLAEFCAIDASWKTLSVMIMYPINYLASHNDAQPELYDETENLNAEKIV